MKAPFKQPLPEGEFLIQVLYGGAQAFGGIYDPSAVKTPRFAWTISRIGGNVLYVHVSVQF